MFFKYKSGVRGLLEVRIVLEFLVFFNGFFGTTYTFNALKAAKILF